MKRIFDDVGDNWNPDHVTMFIFSPIKKFQQPFQITFDNAYKLCNLPIHTLSHQYAPIKFYPNIKRP